MSEHEDDEKREDSAVLEYKREREDKYLWKGKKIVKDKKGKKGERKESLKQGERNDDLGSPLLLV
jgi:hypothetical protein